MTGNSGARSPSASAATSRQIPPTAVGEIRRRGYNRKREPRFRRPDDRRPAPAHRGPLRVGRGPADPPGHRPDGGGGTGPRHHGTQRIGQVDAGQRPARQPRLRGHRRDDPVPRRGHHHVAHRRPGQGRHVPGLPGPRGHRRPTGHPVPAPGALRPPGDGPVGARGAPDDDGVDGQARHGSELRRAPPQRGLLRWGEEAQRDPPDGHAGARPGHPRRDRLRTRRRRPAHGGPRRPHRARVPARPRGARDQPLPAHARRAPTPTASTCWSTGRSSRKADPSSAPASSPRGTTHGGRDLHDGGGRPRPRHPGQGLPPPRTRGARASHHLPRLRGVVAATDGRARRHARVRRDHPRQRAPRRLRHCRGGHPTLRGGPDQRGPLHRRTRAVP